MRIVAMAALLACLGAAAHTSAQDRTPPATDAAAGHRSAEPGTDDPGAGGLSDPSGPGEVPPPPAAEAPVPPPPAGGEIVDDDYRVEPDPVLRLDGWLRLNDERNSTARIAGGILGLVVGAAAVSGAVWAFTLDDPELRGTLGSLFVLDSVIMIGLGVAMLNVTTPQEDRYQRWLRARERGATLVDVAGFAGEFYAEAEAQRFARLLAAISGFAMAAGGAATVAMGAAMDFGPEGDDGRLISVTLGGTFLVTGALLGLVATFVKSPIEEDWERYQQGLTPIDPHDPSPSIAVSPAFGQHFAGVALRGEM